MNVYPSGTRIAGRYEVAGCPLMGGMGTVYICLDHQEDRPVALKTFKPQYLPDRAARDRFLREGTAWVNLGAHPHIVRCYRVFRIDPEVYLVLELVAKEQGRGDASLRSWLTPGVPLPVEQALLFALQIVRGMAHATARIEGFVHRDLKPENVLVGADQLSNAAINRLRVTDFGLAAVLQATTPQIPHTPPPSHPHTPTLLTRTELTHGIVGTPLYMAPEQWRGEQVTVATDVYALGCILYEMLAGQRAVAGHSLAALQHAHCEGEVRLLSPDVPQAVRALVARCLTVGPGERYESWEAVDQVLAHAYEGMTDHQVPAVEPAARLSQKERVAAGWSYSAMGVSYMDIGKSDVAVGYFERVVQIGRAEKERRLEGAGLGNLGYAYTRLGDARRAVEYHEQALAITREVGDWQDESIGLANLGSAYAELGEVRRAIECLERAMATIRKVSDRHTERSVLSNLGSAYLALGDARRAIEYCEQTLAICREIGDQRGESSALNSLGNAYDDLGDVWKAVMHFEQALAICRRIGDRYGEGNVLNDLGIAHVHQGKLQQAISYYEQALRVAREIGDRRGASNALGNLGNAHADLGNAGQAIKYHEEVLVVAREAGNRVWEGSALGNLGGAYLQLGDAQQDIRFSEQALTIHQEIGDRRKESNALNNLGNAYYVLGDAQQATKHYEQSLTIARELEDPRGEGNALNNLALVYRELGDVQRAIRCYEQALAIDRKVGNRGGEGYTLSNLGIAYDFLGDARRAVGYYEQALVIDREIGDRRGEGIVLGNLGVAYRHLGNISRAIKCYEQALLIAHEVGDADGLATRSFNLALLHQQQSLPNKALALAQQAVEVWTRIGSPKVHQAQQLVTRLQGTRGYDFSLEKAKFNAHPIKDGDIVAQHRHYEFDEARGTILLNGPAQEYEGTKWRVKKIGKTAAEITPPVGMHYSGPGGEESYVELELIEGEYKHWDPNAEPDKSSFDDFSEYMQQMIEWIKGKTASESPGYTMQISSCPAYRRHFPNKNLLQQFFEEWTKVD